MDINDKELRDALRNAYCIFTGEELTDSKIGELIEALELSCLEVTVISYDEEG